MITEQQLIGWKNLETAKVCWATSEYDIRSKENQNLMSKIYQGKSIKREIKQICKKNNIDFSKVDILEVTEVHQKASKIWWDGLRK